MLSENNPQSFIAEGQKSYLVALSEDKRPQYIVTFGGSDSGHSPETISAEDWIGKKGYTAKGKKCHDRYKVKKVEFTDPLPAEEEDVVPDAEPVKEESFSEPIDLVVDLPEIDTQKEAVKEPKEEQKAKSPKNEPIELFEEPTLF